MSRYFTLAEAERLVPQVEKALRDAIFHKAEYQKADRELDTAHERIRLVGGARVDPSAFIAMRSRRDTSTAGLKSSLDRIERTGALVKDLDTGLIDFLTLYEGREVCLCWRLGEDRIRFWHGIDEGFRGRKLIDQDFLNGHRAC